MEYNNFQTITHAKAILAGEHAVLRGSPAVVIPVLNKTFRLTYLSIREMNHKRKVLIQMANHY